jgi:hypothetical protein
MGPWGLQGVFPRGIRPIEDWLPTLTPRTSKKRQQKAKKGNEKCLTQKGETKKINLAKK